MSEIGSFFAMEAVDVVESLGRASGSTLHWTLMERSRIGRDRHQDGFASLPID